MWAIEEKDNLKEAEWPTRVTYGEPLEAFKVVEGPRPLLSGCYEAAVIGTGAVRFYVHSDGTIEERPSNEIGNPYPPPEDTDAELFRSPEDLTGSRELNLAKWIADFVGADGHLPASTQELPLPAPTDDPK